MEDLLSATTFHIAEVGDKFVFADGEKGVRKETGENGRAIHATLFPYPSTLGCSFDPALCFDVGKAVGEECVSDGVDMLFAADANVKDSPDPSRYSEDPFLTG